MKKQPSNKVLTEAKQYIEQHYCEPIMLEQLAEQYSLSATYLSSIFKQAYQVTPTEYVTVLRIQKAKQLIQAQQSRIRDIAIEVGYSDEFYFSRVFKKVEGMSPSQYAEQQHMNVALVSGALLGYAAAADIVPAAAPLNAKWTPYYYTLWLEHDVQVLTGYDPEDMQTINELLQLNADLVIAPVQLPSQHAEKLNSHVPVYWLDHTKDCFQVLDALGKQLAKEASVKEWMKQYNKQLIQARDQLSWHRNNAKVQVIRIYKDQLFAYCNRAIAHLLYEQLGAVSSYSPSNLAGHHTAIEGLYNDEITTEELFMMEIEHLFVIVCPEDQSRVTWHHLQRELKEHNAVLEQHTYVVHSDPWFEYSPIAQRRMLEQLVVFVSP